jgi:RNA recognition motif-containing protein
MHPQAPDALWDIQYVKFRFSRGVFADPRTAMLRAMYVESPHTFPEMYINTEHPLYRSQIGSQADEMYESKLIRYVGTVGATAYASQKFQEIPNATQMRYLAEKFEASFVREWRFLSESRVTAPCSAPTLAPMKKFHPTGPNHIDTRFSTPTLASVSRSPGRSTKSPSSILSVDIETAKANLYICGIPRHWKQNDLYEKFVVFGEILSCKIWSDRCGSEQNAGSGFVQFVHHADAQKAVDELNNTKIEDMLRPLQVKFANSSKKRTARSSSAGENIYVSGLPLSFNDEKLHALFKPHGEIESVLVLPPKKQYSALTGFVKFVRREDAEEALERMDRSVIPDPKENYIISCSWAKGSKNTREDVCTNVYVTGCDPLWQKSDVFEFFSHFGEIVSVAMMNPRGEDGCQNTIAFVKYRSPQAAQACVDTANGLRLPTMNIPLSVRFSKHQNF